jgi:UDP-N-acetylmuramate: L-alanyl-gamma-D-glutamyl-meso-diaminopimelate ligase
VVIFEPRSWSLRRNFFQDLLPTSLAYADEIVIKDVYDKEKIPATERLGIGKLKADLEARGKKVHVCEDFEEIKRFVAAMDFARSQVLILLSNGDVGDFTAWVRGLCSKTGKT